MDLFRSISITHISTVTWHWLIVSRNVLLLMTALWHITRCIEKCTCGVERKLLLFVFNWAVKCSNKRGNVRCIPSCRLLLYLFLLEMRLTNQKFIIVESFLKT